MSGVGPVTTVDEMVARLEELDGALPPSDGLRWFNRLFLEVTRAVRDDLQQGSFEATPFLERLDVFVGNAYFTALDTARAHPQEVGRAWSPLFEARDDPRIAPLQFALAGMNAHVNHDLGVCVVATCQELGVEPGGPQHHDYDAVNDVVRDTEAQVKEWLLTGALEELDHAVAPADDVAALWSIGRARAAAWARAEVLWRLRDDPDLTAVYLEVNDRAAELAGRAFLLPLPLPAARPT